VWRYAVGGRGCPQDADVVVIKPRFHNCSYAGATPRTRRGDPGCGRLLTGANSTDASRMSVSYITLPVRQAPLGSWQDMLSFPENITSFTRSRLSTSTFPRILIIPRLARAVLTAVLFLCICFGFLWSHLSNEVALGGAEQDDHKESQTAAGVIIPPTRRLHLLVPATSSNSDLCKLLLSSQILGYPTPVLINFGEPEDENAYIQHLPKIEGILDYLDGLKQSEEYLEDLVLIVDGYDVWFQLRRDVLIGRYLASNERANTRLIDTYGPELVDQYDIRQTIIFGPDKICWPVDYSRPACWAVPESTLPEFAFGPQTGMGREEHNQPRWLNSGTIIGPAQDLRQLFRATLADIHNNHTVDSDQFYLAEIFGRQEYARLLRRPALLQHSLGIRYGKEANMPDWIITRLRPDTLADSRTEYHIGIDYESAMFQTLAFWKQYLTWMRPRDSWRKPLDTTINSYRFDVPDDLAASPAPFNVLRKPDPPGDVNSIVSWQDVELLYNIITGNAPVMLHFTGEKRFRDVWWKKMWFQSDAARLRSLSLQARQPDHLGEHVIGGFRWINAEPDNADEVELHGAGGVWSDKYRGWYSWRGLCKPFEDELLRIPDDAFFHAPSRLAATDGQPQSSASSGEAEGKETAQSVTR